nr:hypothetical protein [Puniceibacterium confluentis]
MPELLRQGRADGFGPGERLDRFRAQLAAKTGLFESAHRHDLIGLGISVDPDAPGFETTRHAMGPVDIPGPDRGREAVERDIALPERFFLVLEWDH